MTISRAVLAGAAITFLLAVASVALWTLRVAVTSQGRRVLGAVVAGVEALTFVAAFSRIMANLDNAAGVVAYAAGVGVGTMVGLIADARMSRGQSWVRVIVEGDGVEMADVLRERLWPVTTIAGHGPFGPVSELLIAVDDRNLPALLHDVDAVSPAAFRTVERLKTARGRPLPQGMRQVADHSRHQLHHHLGAVAGRASHRQMIAGASRGARRKR